MKIAFRIRNSALSAVVFAFMGLAVASSPAIAAKAKPVDSKETALTVNFDDLRGYADPQVEWLREDLLENAFYDATRRLKSDINYIVGYNESLPKIPKNLLNIRVVDWRRSPANFYEFRAVATYYDNDGVETKLGSVFGTRSGIAVFNRYDVGDHFSDAAQDAISSALKKLKKEIS